LRERDPKDQEYLKSAENAEDIKKSKRKFCSLEKEYGHPYNEYLGKWNWWRDRAFERVKNLILFEVKYDIEVNYEQMPKYKKIVDILEENEQEFVGSDLYQEVY